MPVFASHEAPVLSPSPSRRSAKVAALTTLVLSLPLSGVLTGTAYADSEAGPGAELHKISICHATGSVTNPFVFITPSKSGVVNGHVGHQDADDIIPSFSYVDHGTTKTFAGQNATAANLALLAAGTCPAPAAPAAPPAPPTQPTQPTKGNGGDAGKEDGKVTICHATGSASNPFVLITPSKSGVVNGHIGHQDADDIIPGFSYDDHGTTKTFPGQNATAANLALLAAGKCPAPAVVAPAAPPAVVPPAAQPVVVVPAAPPVVVVPAAPPVVLGPPSAPATGPAPVVTQTGSGGSGVTVQAPGAPSVVPASQPVVAAGAGTTLPAFGSGSVTTVPAFGSGSVSGAAATRPTSLPFTGADTGRLAGLSLVLILTGTGALALGRKQTSVA